MIRDQELAGLAMTLARDAKITITVGGDDSFCKPDGSHINIARMPSTQLGRMLMTGLVFHEIGHKNYTKGGRPGGLLGDMMNVIEDIRVDRETVNSRPGTCFNLEAVTNHYVSKGSLEPANLAQALLGKVMAFGYGRVLNHASILPLETQCTEMMDDAFGQEFIDEVETVIKNIPNLKSTKDSTEMAKRLVNLMIQHHAKLQQGGKQTVRTGKMDTGNGTTKNQTEEIEEMINNGTGYGDRSALIRKELDKIAESIPNGIKLGIPVLPLIGRLTATNGKLDEVEAISASSRMRARLMGLLQSMKKRPRSYGTLGRRLATGRLGRMATGDPRVFRKKVETREVNTAVMVLLDLSGSMRGRHRVANTAAFALHHTLFGLKGVSVCTAEFSGKSSKPEVNILVDFGRKPLSENFNQRPFDGTPTHTAIWAGRAMLLQRPEPRKIMLILTDGCPDSGSETRAATWRTMKDGIEIAAIGIMEENVKAYWDNNRIINSIQELPVAMFGIMEQMLVANPASENMLNGGKP